MLYWMNLFLILAKNITTGETEDVGCLWLLDDTYTVWIRGVCDIYWSYNYTKLYILFYINEVLPLENFFLGRGHNLGYL